MVSTKKRNKGLHSRRLWQIGRHEFLWDQPSQIRGPKNNRKSTISRETWNDLFPIPFVHPILRFPCFKGEKNMLNKLPRFFWWNKNLRQLWTRWWFQPIQKNISQIGHVLQIGVKIKNSWNYHLVNHLEDSGLTPQKPTKPSDPSSKMPPPWKRPYPYYEHRNRSRPLWSPAIWS